jgi:hypothetical protein
MVLQYATYAHAAKTSHASTYYHVVKKTHQNLQTNQHNKAIHTVATTLLANPSTQF